MLVVLTIAILVIVVGLIVFILVYLIRKYIRFRKTLVEQEDLLDEVGDLNERVEHLVKENERILAMKVSQLGLKPGESDTVDVEDAENSNDLCCEIFQSEIDEIAEQLKAGGKNEWRYI